MGSIVGAVQAHKSSKEQKKEIRRAEEKQAALEAEAEKKKAATATEAEGVIEAENRKKKKGVQATFTAREPSSIFTPVGA